MLHYHAVCDHFFAVFTSDMSLVILIHLCYVYYVHILFQKFFIMENGDATDTGLSDSYLAQSYAVMEGKG